MNIQNMKKNEREGNGKNKKRIFLAKRGTGVHFVTIGITIE
ncbi:hypothetical protein [uncultured Bacteroides sp.]|nr:hypothetical protein [uncultured Bacteroides sp.]